MNPLIEQLKTNILEDGMDDARAERLVHLLVSAKLAQVDGKAEEDTLKDIWWDAYQTHGVSKTVTIAGVKMVCNDAGEPKETVTPGHFRLADDWDQKYDVGALIEAGVITWVPESKQTTPGRKGGVSVTLPKIWIDDTDPMSAMVEVIGK